jgi:hypothetical protein
VRRVVFVDLDDTLFQSRRKCPAGQGLEPAAWLADGSAHSFMTARQAAFLQLLGTEATLVPTTARNRDAFARVSLAFDSWCILDYGGILLDAEGEPDRDWLARTAAGAEASIDALRALLTEAQGFINQAGLAVRARIIEDLGIPLYLVAKYRDGAEAHLERLHLELIAPWVAASAGAYRLHRNDNNLAVIPRHLGKEFAVRHLIERLRQQWGEILTLGVGDSLIDAAFMAECDYAIVPRDTQLARAAIGSLAMCP